MIKTKKVFKPLWVDEEIYNQAKKQAEKENLKVNMLLKIIISNYLIVKQNEN